MTFAVGLLCRYKEAPKTSNGIALKRLLAYLKTPQRVGLCYNPAGALVGFCDADYAANIDNRKSTSGHCFTGRGPYSLDKQTARCCGR